MLSRVVDHLYIGKAHLANFPDMLLADGITSVLKLHESPPDWDGSEFVVRDLVIPDGEPLDGSIFDEMIAFVDGEIKAGKTVLVVCGAGISRSSTAVLAYLVSTGMELKEAYQLLIRQHPQALPHPDLWESLIAYFDLPYTVNDD
jgi:dual specificity phosphatase 12